MNFYFCVSGLMILLLTSSFAVGQTEGTPRFPNLTFCTGADLTDAWREPGRLAMVLSPATLPNGHSQLQLQMLNSFSAPGADQTGSSYKVVTEAVAGAASGLLVALAMYAIAPGEEDTPLAIASLGYVAGIPIGVSLVGKSGQGSGSVSGAFLGSFLGGLASLPVVLFVWDKEDLAALGAVSVAAFPIAGATIGFNLF